MENLSIGDVVWLKSNRGVLMTVKFIQPIPYSESEESEAYCQWFEEKTLREGMFPVKSLVKRNE